MAAHRIRYCCRAIPCGAAPLTEIERYSIGALEPARPLCRKQVDLTETEPPGLSQRLSWYESIHGSRQIQDQQPAPTADLAETRHRPGGSPPSAFSNVQAEDDIEGASPKGSSLTEPQSTPA